MGRGNADQHVELATPRAAETPLTRGAKVGPDGQVFKRRGSRVSKAIVDLLRDDVQDARDAAYLARFGPVPETLAGEIYVLTGRFPKEFHPRSKAVELLEAKGALVFDGKFEQMPWHSVTALIHGAVATASRSTTRKFEKAVELGIPILGEDDFRHLIKARG